MQEEEFVHTGNNYSCGNCTFNSIFHQFVEPKYIILDIQVILHLFYCKYCVHCVILYVVACLLLFHIENFI